MFGGGVLTAVESHQWGRALIAVEAQQCHIESRKYELAEIFIRDIHARVGNYLGSGIWDLRSGIWDLSVTYITRGLSEIGNCTGADEILGAQND